MKATEPTFFSYPGEMASIMREKEWSLTPVGEPDTWPQSLQTLLGVVLHSKFPMLILWGPDLICFYNDAFRPSLGVNGKHPSLLGQPAKEAWAEIWDTISPLIKQVMAGGEAIWSEDQLIPIYRNGHIEDVYWTFSYSRIANDYGEPYGVLVTCVETTGKILAQSELEESKNLLQFATDAAELGTWDYNPQTGKFTANQRLKQWFGLEPTEEIALETAIAIIAEKDRQRVIDAMSASLDFNIQAPYDLQYTIVHPQTKNETTVQVKGRPFFDDNGVAYRFSGTMEDITSHLQERKKLALAEERAQLATAAANLGTFDINLIEKSSIVSPRFQEIFDIGPDTPHAEIVERIHPEDLEIRRLAHIEALVTGHLLYEVRVIRTDHQIVRIRAEGRVMTDEQGVAYRIVGTILDITEQHEQDKKREEYLAIASHELRNPMTSLKLALDLMDNMPQNNQERSLLDKSKQQVQRLIAISGELLNVSKISTGNLVLNWEVINMKQVIEDSIITAQAGTGLNNFTITGAPDVNIKADKFRLEQVLVNLLTNASKYSPKGSEIIIDVSVNETEVKVKVIDKGIGIDEKGLEKVFKKFSRVESETKVDGHGLGLYISEQIIRKHGGQIGVESKKGIGSTFWFSLPR